MTGEDYYRVLGVPPDADLSQIRAAYVSLLKRYHPDQAGTSEALENGAEVHRIVGAYRTLKDPGTRAEYDARRMAHKRLDLQSASAVLARIHHPRKRFRLDRDTILYVLMLIAAAIGLQLLVSRALELRTPRPVRPVLAKASSVRDIPIYPQLQTIVRNAGMLSGPEASKYSARCFAAAQRSRNPAAADPCVGFDMAYVYWRETEGGSLVADPYFQPVAMGARARDAFPALSAISASARIQSVRAATLKAIIQTTDTGDELAREFSGNQTFAAAKQTPSHGLPKNR